MTWLAEATHVAGSAEQKVWYLKYDTILVYENKQAPSLQSCICLRETNALQVPLQR